MGILGSVLGIVVLLVIAVLFSNNRKAINLRTVLRGFGDPNRICGPYFVCAVWP